MSEGIGTTATPEKAIEPAPKNKLLVWGEWMRDKITSFLLVILTLFIGAVSILFLSATLAQTRLSSIAIDGVGISIWKLSYAGEEWSDLRKKLEQAKADRSSAEQDRSELATQSSVAEDKWRRRWAEMGPLLELLGQRITADYPELILQSNDLATEYIVKVLARRQELLKKFPDLEQLLENISKGSRDFNDAQDLQAATRAQSRWLLSKLNTLGEDVKTAQARLDEVFVSIKTGIDAPTRSRIENAFFELYSRNLFGSSWTTLLTTQPDTLTLWLVLFMGVLGSSLQVTHAYFKTGVAGTLGGYFLRLSVGALAAVIIFIVAKGGVPVIADFSRIGGDAAINPYFVSFLAIISGLLSENAIANIQAQGARVFGQAATQGTARWARRDLTEELKQAGFDAKNLAPRLSDTDIRTAAMIKGEESMTQSQQEVISLALRTNLRDLFTDIAPPKKAD